MHGTDVFHDLDAPFYALRLHWEVRCLAADFRHTELADNIRARLEINTTLVVSTWEVIGYVALFVAFFCAKERSTGELALLASRSPEFLLRKVEIEELSVSSFFDFSGPQRAVHVHKLIYVEGNQSTSNFPLSMLLAEDAEKFLLWVIYQ